jgi:hypothetical protein
MHYCADCAREFAKKASLLQHLADKHGQVRGHGHGFDLRAQIGVPSAPNGLDGEGEWLARCVFEGVKSFGWFRCARCAACWLSAHAFRDEYRQQCKSCRVWSQPRYMWLNYERKDQSDDDDYNGGGDEKEERESKPHHADKCEACMAGVCRSTRDYY